MERKGKSRKSNGRPISGFLPSGIDMLERNFVDGRAVQEYLRKKVEQNPQVHRANKKLYLDWVHTLLAESLSFSRVLKYAQVLITFERFLRKPFRQATRRDLEEEVISLDHFGYKPHYLHDIKVTIRKFYKWLKGTRYGYPEEVRWIHSVLQRSQRRMLPEALLSEEQILHMINACKSVRDRAIIAVLYDSGCRIGEIHTMKIKSVTFDKYGAKIHVKGKTGDRRLRLTISVPLLATWFNMHPKRDDPEAPLWPNGRELPMRYAAFQAMIPRIAQRAGIKTRVFPHLFRHSRATFLASYLTEAQLCARFGWIQGSEQPGTYVHLSGRDADEAILELYGIKKNARDDIELLVPKPCENCNAVNAFNCEVCMNCGFPLKRIRKPDRARPRTHVPTTAWPSLLRREAT